ncbi:hypothetical protein [Gordonia alkaliphila]|uniref:Cell division protein FtsL n=1 Tax=Gordonia alkaliphila TaxID=1053547 RepID=A0ABP8Z5B3_9ACTN
MTLLDDRRSARRAVATRPSAPRAATPRTSVSRGAASASRSGASRSASTEPAAGRRRPPRRAELLTPKKASGVFTGLSDMPFIVPIVVLVIGALGLTLYLSTKAAQDSYQLSSLRQENQALVDKRDNLKRTADSGDSAPELADKAAKLGMVPGIGAHLVVGPDGKARLRGELKPADGNRPGSLNPKPDPVKQIDASKVDDSGGLGGNPAPSEQTPGEQAPNGHTPDGQAPNPAPAPPSVTPPNTATPQAPAPNVLPPSAATPNRNTAADR